MLVSTVGAAPESPVPAFRAKGMAEEALRASGLTSTVLQPDAFMDVWFGMMVEMPIAAGMPVTLVGEARGRHSFIAERDVAAYVLAVARHPEAADATLMIDAPSRCRSATRSRPTRAPSVGTFRDVPVRHVQPGDPIPGLPEPVWGIAAALESYDSPIPMEELTKT